MESIFNQIVQQSPMLGIMLVFWFYQRQDYKEFVDKVQKENSTRELNYQQTIKNLSKCFWISCNLNLTIRRVT